MDRKAGKRREAREARIIGKNVRHALCVLFICLGSFAIGDVGVYGAEKWPGVDESVVEKYASEHGRQAHEPLINTDQGDLLLFVFLLAGAAGGFAAGYYWRMLSEGKAKQA